jgi:hypothetical protein
MSAAARTSILLLALGAALAGCSKEKEPIASTDAGGPECATRADCLALGEEHRGEVCSVNGRCESCASDGQCELREECDPESSRCVFKPGWGDDCSLNADCDAGELCVQGLCVSEREATLCVDGECLAEGQRCNRVNGVCEQDLGCLSDTDCAQAEICNVPSHACVTRCTAETVLDDCGLGQVCYEGRCSACATNADCPSGLACDLKLLQCVTDGSARCLSDRDCEVGLTCNAATGFCTSEPPPCLSDEDCLADERCEVSSGRCEPGSCQPDRWEPNDQRADAKQLAAGTFSGMTLCNREQDWYSLTMARGDRLDVFVDADPMLDGLLETRLLDAQGRVLVYGSLALDRTVAANGTYYLELQSTDSWVLYGLRLSISKGVPCDDDRFEPNDYKSMATSLNSAGEVDGLTICGPDVDYYFVRPPAGQGARIELHQEPTEGDLDLLVLAPDGVTELGRSETLEPVESVEIPAAQAPEDGLIVRVGSDDDRAHASYYLTISWLAGAE